MNKVYLCVVCCIAAIATNGITLQAAIEKKREAYKEYVAAKGKFERAKKRYEVAMAENRNVSPETTNVRKTRPINVLAAGKVKTVQAQSQTAKGIMTKRQEAFFKTRRIATARDVTSIPGSVIVRYERNGKLDSITTNVLKSVAGAAQNNPIQERLNVIATLYENATNKSESVKANFYTWKNGLKLQTSKAIAEELEKILFR